jgi:hypothetical protein
MRSDKPHRSLNHNSGREQGFIPAVSRALQTNLTGSERIKDLLDISPRVENPNDLEREGVRVVDDDVVGIAL